MKEFLLALTLVSLIAGGIAGAIQALEYYDNGGCRYPNIASFNPGYIAVCEIVKKRWGGMMSLYHEAECGHSVEFGRKCQQCAHAKHQAENDRLKQAVEVFREALSDNIVQCSMDDPEFGNFTQLQFTSRLGLIHLRAKQALERAEAILKGGRE